MNRPIAASKQPYHNQVTQARMDARAPGGLSGGGAVLLAVAALFLISAAIGERAALVRSVPSLGRIFAMAGLPVAGHGPVLLKLASQISGQSQQRLLAVEGEISNPDSHPVAVPALRVSVRAADGHEIYHWVAQPPKSSLAAGETISFRAKLADPPSDARQVFLRFADAEDGLPPSRSSSGAGTAPEVF